MVAPRKVVVRAITTDHRSPLEYFAPARQCRFATDSTGQQASLEEFLILPSYENPRMWSALSEDSESAREVSHEA